MSFCSAVISSTSLPRPLPYPVTVRRGEIKRGRCAWRFYCEMINFRTLFELVPKVSSCSSWKLVPYLSVLPQGLRSCCAVKAHWLSPDPRVDMCLTTFGVPPILRDPCRKMTQRATKRTPILGQAWGTLCLVKLPLTVSLRMGLSGGSPCKSKRDQPETSQ